MSMEKECADVLSPEVLLSRRVQEMVINGDDPPQLYQGRVRLYSQKEDEDEEEEEEDYIRQNYPVPIIDLSLLSSSTHELERLSSALSSWGCFQAIGHGVQSHLLDKMNRVAREFFEQPMEEKQKYAKEVNDFQGYGADPVPEEGQFLDWSDRLFLEVFPEDQRDYKFWPKTPASFSETTLEYCSKMKELTEETNKAMARCLNLEEDCFQKQFGERQQLQPRFNYYSPCKRPDLILGLKPHADGSAYTVILQDEVGLQILKDAKWFTVPKNPDALLILMGDQMEIMSNGVFKSPVHRVLSSSERDRVSVAVFYTPEKGKEIGPEEGLVKEHKQNVFKKVTDYANVHWEYYQRGMRALHTARP